MHLFHCKRTSITRLAFLLFVVTPLAAWFLVKPIRVLAPAIAGLPCTAEPVCVEKPEDLDAATALYNEGIAFVSRRVAPIEGRPRFIFCASDACAHTFGLGTRSAITVGDSATVIGPRAWKAYYVRHELIHHLQVQRLGVVRTLLRPSWLIEGMAYALSEDPRTPLAEPLETYRKRFLTWYDKAGHAALWDAP